jgi:hypothetical protein
MKNLQLLMKGIRHFQTRLENCEADENNLRQVDLQFYPPSIPQKYLPPPHSHIFRIHSLFE